MRRNRKGVPKVYFISMRGAPSRVKIGYTTNLKQRIKALVAAMPYPLDVLAAINASRQYEKELHERFAEHRIKGEWFEVTTEIRAFIDGLPKTEYKSQWSVGVASRMIDRADARRAQLTLV